MSLIGGINSIVVLTQGSITVTVNVVVAKFVGADVILPFSVTV